MAPEVEIVNSSSTPLALPNSVAGSSSPGLEALWESAIKTANQTGAPTAAPGPEARGSPAGPSLFYQATQHPMISEPYRGAIQDRLRRRRENVGPYPLAPTTADIAAHYASMPHPPSIK